MTTKLKLFYAERDCTSLKPYIDISMYKNTFYAEKECTPLSETIIDISGSKSNLYV